MQAYFLLKDRIFLHTLLYDPQLLEDTGMDIEFETLWRAMKWETFDPMDEEGSRLYTIQFLCTLEENVDGISFHLFNQHYDVSWVDLSAHIGFNHHRCALNIDFALPAFDRAKFRRKFW